MSLKDVRRRLVDRLDEGDRGDRGWFVITRIHVAVSWLKGIAEYLENQGSAGNVISLTGHDYRRLATIIGTDSDDPGVQLRRHHLLVMDKPLQLLQRVDGRKWNQIVLTKRGRDLAYSSDPAVVLEQSLSAVQFAVEPWTPSVRVRQYQEFGLRVYEVMIEILQHCDGYIDRNEFDFFVSRIRRSDEAAKTIAAIKDYRALATEEQDTLHTEVSDRIPGAKAYSNWRDVGLHTFSLFSLGTSMMREGTRLLLTADWVGAYAISPTAPGASAIPVTPTLLEAATVPKLRIPEPPEVEDLLSPPAASASNDGADAESFVAKVLRSQGWEVAFYTNRRGYGFDLWARRENRAMVVEVKSSLDVLGTVSLTTMEHQAAQEYGDSYVLALVEHMDSVSPRLHMIQNPVAALEIKERMTASYEIARVVWHRTIKGNA